VKTGLGLKPLRGPHLDRDWQTPPRHPIVALAQAISSPLWSDPKDDIHRATGVIGG